MVKGKAFITRPREDSAFLAHSLAEMGYDPQLIPLLEPIYYPISLPIAKYNIITTSKHAKESVTGLEEAKIMSLSDFGNVDNLVQYIYSHFPPGEKFIYLRGKDISHNLKEMLAGRGYEIEEHVTYEMRKKKELTQEEQALLKASKPGDIIIFLSQRTAETFVELAKKYDLTNIVKLLTAYSFSNNIRKTLQKLFWYDIIVTGANLQQMLERIKL